MHMGIPVSKRAWIAEKVTYGDAITHDEVVRIWGLTYILNHCSGNNKDLLMYGSSSSHPIFL